jgi:hypothetical protein
MRAKIGLGGIVTITTYYIYTYAFGASIEHHFGRKLFYLILEQLFFCFAAEILVVELNPMDIKIYIKCHS